MDIQRVAVGTCLLILKISLICAVTLELISGLCHDSPTMAIKKPKAKTHKAILKSNIRKVAKTNAADDLNDVAARLMMQSERNVVTQAAALLIRKTS
jgi:hypothetical protein